MATYQLIGLVYAAVGLITALVFGGEAIARKTLAADKLSVSPLLMGLVRLMMGVLFIYSGFVKANDYIGFGYKLDEYFHVFAEDFPAFEGFFLGIMKPMSIYLAWFLSVLEIALGVAVMLGYRMKGTMWFTLLLMVFFTFLTAYSALPGLDTSDFSWHKDMMKVTDCGCFGDALPLKPHESFYKDLILLLMTLPLFLTKSTTQPLINNKVGGWLTALTFIAFGIFAYACHEYLPLIDYRPYAIGVDLAKCSTEDGPEPGVPKCKDYPEVYRINVGGKNDTIVEASVKIKEVIGKDTVERDSTTKYSVAKWYGQDNEIIDELKGNVLVIVMYNMDKAPKAEIERSINLYNDLKGSGVKVLCMTGAGRDDLNNKYIPEFKIPYQLSLRDGTMLKTIIRSNPGYMLLKNGVVVKKWHYNMTPTAGKIKVLLE